MDCCKFEHQMTRIIPSFAGFTEFTTSIPKMYWDVKSQEQRIFGICKMLNKVICYADMLGENVDEIAKTLQDIEDGKLDPIIIAAINQWFIDNQPLILADISALQAALPITDYDAEHTVSDAITDINTKIGDGFDSENTVADAINQAEENSKTLVRGNIRDMAWKCTMRNIVDHAYTLNVIESMQGFTEFEINGVRYVLQAAMLDEDEVLILYNYDTNTEIYRLTGSFGHINDITYKDGYAYTLNEQTDVLSTFLVNESTITFLSSEVIDINTAAIEIMPDNTWYTVYSQGANQGIEVFHYNNAFTELLETWYIPWEGTAYVQGVSVNGTDVFIAMALPNSIIYLDTKDNYYYFYNIPQYIGHCYTDEVEGVHVDADKNIYFNTYSIVDLQLMCSVFQTNLNHNIEKEIDASLAQNRYGVIAVDIDGKNGDLVSPGRGGKKFKLVGDAINYARSLGILELTVNFVSDYDYPIVAIGVNMNFTIDDDDIAVNLNGLYIRYSRINFENVSRFILNPRNISTFTIGGIIYGGYIADSDFYIGVSTWHALEDPNVYDETHKRIFFRNCNVLIQEHSYYRFYNCIVTSGSDTLSPNSSYERTVVLAHVS